MMQLPPRSADDLRVNCWGLSRPIPACPRLSTTSWGPTNNTQKVLRPLFEKSGSRRARAVDTYCNLKLGNK
jgi:hypothetical protein